MSLFYWIFNCLLSMKDRKKGKSGARLLLLQVSLYKVCCLYDGFPLQLHLREIMQVMLNDLLRIIHIIQSKPMYLPRNPISRSNACRKVPRLPKLDHFMELGYYSVNVFFVTFEITNVLHLGHIQYIHQPSLIVNRSKM